MKTEFINILLSAFLKLLLVYVVYMVIGMLAFGFIFVSYVFLQYIETTSSSIFTISMNDILRILSVFETDNDWVFLKSFAQNILFNLPFSDTIALGENIPNTGAAFPAIGIIIEYFSRIITGKGFASQAERMQLWTDLLPGLAISALATLFFKLLLMPKRKIEESQQDIGFKIFFSVFSFFLYVYIAIACFYCASAIIKCVAIELKNDAKTLYFFYYVILLLSLLFNAKFLKTFIWKLLLDILFSLVGSILLYFLCDLFISINWLNLTIDDQFFFIIVRIAAHFLITCFFFLGVDELKNWIYDKEEKSKKISLKIFKKKATPSK